MNADGTHSSEAHEILVRLTDVCLGYGRSEVLRDVSLTIHSNEFWCIVGPNGSGKTTLARAILGLLKPRAGVLTLARRLHTRAGIGFVPQQCTIAPSLPTTVREFVSLGLVGLHTPRAQAYVHVREALKRVGLDGHERRDFHTLSGGQRQRALVARALVRRPRLLIADEPTNGLDPGARHRLREVLRDLRRDTALAMLFVTHDLEIARQEADRVALLSAGRVIVGAPRTILTEEHIANAFFCSGAGGVT